MTSVLTSEVVPGVGGHAGVLVLPAVVPGGRALPGALRLHLDHQRDPLVFGAWWVGRHTGRENVVTSGVVLRQSCGLHSIREVNFRSGKHFCNIVTYGLERPPKYRGQPISGFSMQKKRLIYNPSDGFLLGSELFYVLSIGV